MFYLHDLCVRRDVRAGVGSDLLRRGLEGTDAGRVVLPAARGGPTRGHLREDRLPRRAR